MSEATPAQPFIRFLTERVEADDRVFLATLRQSLQHPEMRDPKAVFRLGGWLRGNPEAVRTRYLFAGLFALFHQGWLQAAKGTQSFPVLWSELVAEKRRKSDDPDPIQLEVRFQRLLKQSREEIRIELALMLKMLSRQERVPDWERLLRDLYGWSAPGRYVQRRWLEEYSRRRPPFIPPFSQNPHEIP